MKHKRGCFMVDVAECIDVDAYSVCVTNIDTKKSLWMHTFKSRKSMKQNLADIRGCVGLLVTKLIKDKK